MARARRAAVNAPISVAEAQARLFALAPRVGTEEVALAAATGRWLAGPLIARHDRPAANLSVMDGYALRFADLPGPLTVVGESAAGRAFPGALGPGQAARIFTGAVMPAGADTVLVQEEARREGDQVTLAGEGPAVAGGNVRSAGIDFPRDTVLLEAGTRLTPGALALAASAGHATLRVNRRLRIGMIATGDELVPPGSAVTRPEQLPESNGAMLAGMLADLPVEPIDMGIIPDRAQALAAAFGAFRGDILVTSGGASVGDHDLVRPALLAAGGTIDFWRIAMRPGRPMMAGRLGDAVVLGLPGNPVSAFVTALLFLRPLVATMAGAAQPLPFRHRARLGAPLGPNDVREDYLRARLVGGRAIAAERQDSSMLQTLARADCLIVRPPYAPAAAEDEWVEILPLF